LVKLERSLRYPLGDVAILSMNLPTIGFFQADVDTISLLRVPSLACSTDSGCRLRMARMAGFELEGLRVQCPYPLIGKQRVERSSTGISKPP
jgi:hypothetical protein